ncbi:MAG TPA: hypothetical protein VHP83_14475, partial [Aggregatilineaceae bacterium]|nr:hypothetical protein [Aggregatilineaceae bacterium]
MRQRHWLFGVTILVVCCMLILPNWSGDLSPKASRALASPPAVAAAGVTLDVPSPVYIGDTFTFTVSFDNTAPNVAGNVGYGPFIDLVLPVNGADGAAGTSTPDGIDFSSATYLGVAVTTYELTFPAGTGCVAHPYAFDTTHTPLQVCGTPGDKLVVIVLPFGSFAPDQPAADIEITAQVSNLADLDVPLPIRARGGFRYGNDALDNWCCDPVLLSQSSPNSTTWSPSETVTPTLLTVTKTNDGPEGETATGPNYPRTYTVTVDVANGQTLTNLNVTDYFDDNIVITGVSNFSPAGSVVSLGGAAPVYPYGPASTPNNTLVVNFPSITGTASFDVEFYVPLNDAGAGAVLDAITGDDSVTENRVAATASWTPLDGRDPLTPITVNGTCPSCPPANTLADKSIATQKSVRVVTSPLRSGAILEYTIEFQISDYFTFDDLILTDTFSDGQRFNAAFTPTISVTDRTETRSGSMSVLNPGTATCAAAGADNVIVDVSQIGNNPDPATDGSTTVTFCISEALLDLSAADGIVQGGRAVAPNAGAATGTITFQTVVQDQFSDTYLSGDPSVPC